MKPCACDEHEARKANKKPKLDGDSFLAMVKAKAAAKKLETCPHYLRGKCTYARLAALTQCGYCHPADPPAKNIVCSLKRARKRRHLLERPHLRVRAPPRRGGHGRRVEDPTRPPMMQRVTQSHGG